MKRGKNAEEASGDGENDTSTGTTAHTRTQIHMVSSENKTCELSPLWPNIFLQLTASAKKAKKTKEPEAPILYEDPPDKLTSKDGRSANMKISSWNVDGLRAWVKKNGLDVSLR